MDQLCGDPSSRVQGLNLFVIEKEGGKKGDVSPYILSPALTQIRGYSIRIKRLIAVSMDSSVALSGRSINHADQTIADR